MSKKESMIAHMANYMQTNSDLDMGMIELTVDEFLSMIETNKKIYEYPKCREVVVTIITKSELGIRPMAAFLAAVDYHFDTADKAF